MVIDSKTNPVKTAKVGEGTIARLGLILSGYCAGGKTGVSVKLTTVQIIKLTEYEEDLIKAYGFEEEDGYEAVDEEKDEEEAAEEDF